MEQKTKDLLKLIGTGTLTALVAGLIGFMFGRRSELENTTNSSECSPSAHYNHGRYGKGGVNYMGRR